MNLRIQELADEARIKFSAHWAHQGVDTAVITRLDLKEFAELIVRECIDILETEIELVKGYKSTVCNDFDVRWHEGKIEHFAKLIEKSKKHFGVKE